MMRYRKKILIFNCTSGRSGLSLLGTLLSTLSESPLGTTLTSTRTPFDHVIFCTNTTYAGGISKGGSFPPPPLLPLSFVNAYMNYRLTRIIMMIEIDLTSNGIDLKDLEELKTQHELASAWSELTSSSSSSSLAHDNTITTPTTSQVHIKASIEESISLARSFLKEEEETMGKKGGEKLQVLVTGSLHLVGGVMTVVEIEI
jgi:folylpolyglutamate synthase